jgi:hypothetical protein
MARVPMRKASDKTCHRGRFEIAISKGKSSKEK